MINEKLERTESSHEHNEKGSHSIADIAKYIVLALIVVYVALILVYTSGSTKPFQEIEKSVESSLDTKSMKKADAQGLKRLYGLNSAEFEGVLLYTASESISAEEVLLIQTKDESQIQEVRKAVQNRVENRKNDFEGYAPEQLKHLKQAQISVRGRLVFLAVGPKAAEYKAVFSDSL